MTKKEELIETLWNVNLSTVTGTWYWTNRINRNIVECKSEILGEKDGL